MCFLQSSHCAERDPSGETAHGSVPHNAHGKIASLLCGGFMWYCPNTDENYEIPIGAAGEICPGCKAIMDLK